MNSYIKSTVVTILLINVCQADDDGVVTQNDIFDALTDENSGYDLRDRPMPFGEEEPVEVR